MRSVRWLLLGLVIGGGAGWYMRGLGEQDVHAITEFTFTDNLANPQVSYSRREGQLARRRLSQQDQHGSDYLRCA